MSKSFAQLGLAAPLVDALAHSKIIDPFPIQAEAIPAALDGRDIQGKAPTGSGKTLAFGLPLLQTIGRAKGARPRSLILAPTRELASQIETSLRPLAKAVGRSVYAIYGGVSYGPQRGALRKGIDVLVATPGRLEDLLDQRSLDLTAVEVVVVDEADRMADMGFLPAVRRILDQTPEDTRMMMFSATLDGDIAVLSREYQKDPVRFEAAGFEERASEATHHFWKVKHEDRIAHTAEVIRATGKVIVFTRTRHGADRLAKQLAREDVTAVAMHGGRSQSQRERALRDFSNGRAQALIATDVAARGIHVDDVATVIHFDIPGDSKDYQHRSGRTARAGAGGTVITLLTGGQERGIRQMQRELSMSTEIEAPTPDHFHRLTQGPKRSHQPAAPKRSHEPAATKRFQEPTKRSQDRPASKGAFSLYVGNLPWKVQASELETLFGRFGRVEEVTLVTDRRNGRSKGYGFVSMSGTNPAAVAEKARGASLGGRPLKIRSAV